MSDVIKKKTETALAGRLLMHAQALENQAVYYAAQDKPGLDRSYRATAKLLREAAKELSSGPGR